MRDADIKRLDPFEVNIVWVCGCGPKNRNFFFDLGGG